jgi:hypothetical protein
MIGVDDNFDLVAADADVTAREQLLDAVGMVIEGSYEHVQILVVVGDPGFSRQAWIGVLFGLKLAEVFDDRRGSPDRVVVFAVDHRCARGAHRDSGRGGSRRGWRRGTWW